MSTTAKKLLYMRLISVSVAFFVMLSSVYVQIGSAATAGKAGVSQINNQIEDKKSEIDAINEKIAGVKKEIQKKQSEAANLQNQIAVIDAQTVKTELEMKAKALQLEKVKLELDKVGEEVKIAEENLSTSRERMSELLRLIWRNDERSYLEVILLHDSFADVFDQVKFAENIENNLQREEQKLSRVQQEMVVKHEELTDHRRQIDDLLADLQDTQQSLDYQKNTKTVVVSQVKNSEKEFAKLMEQLRQEQQQINNEIASLERKLREELSKNADSERFRGLGKPVFDWPITSHLITAYFRDPSYPYRKVFEHSAIDIATPQGTTIRAPEAGYVGKTRDAGMGYNYLLIVHNDGLTTVYGHVSKFLVREGEFVTKGQAMALTGGQPGTPGAGSFTTGAHLHFEVRSNGIPVNPLDYLP